jgi:hypothetical protein
MPIIFFEGFNYNNSDTLRLDPFCWSTNSSPSISFGAGRTGNAVRIAPRPINSGLAHNATLTLSNFDDPLVSHSGFGLGFWCSAYQIKTNNNNASPPYAENLISFYNNSTEVLRIDVIKTTYNSQTSMGFGIYQNGTLLDTYDLSSPIGRSWVIGESSTVRYIMNDSYIEIYINPALGQMAMRFSASNSYNTHLLNSSSGIYTNINSFNSLKSIKYYATNDQISTGAMDDLYLTAGNNSSECLLGQDTKIYSIVPNGDSSTMQWKARVNNSETSPSFSYVDDNNGDSGYIYSSTSGNACLFNMSNIDGSAPPNVGGIKIINVVKKIDLNSNMNFTNIMTSGIGGTIKEIGSGYLVDSTSYNYKNTFLFNNPITSGSWTKQQVDNMQLGVKIV